MGAKLQADGSAVDTCTNIVYLPEGFQIDLPTQTVSYNTMAPTKVPI